MVSDDAEAILVPTNDAAALSQSGCCAPSRMTSSAPASAAPRKLRLDEDFNREKIFDRIAAIYDELLARDAAA